MGGGDDGVSLKVTLFLKSEAGLNTRHQWNKPSDGPRGFGQRNAAISTKSSGATDEGISYPQRHTLIVLSSQREENKSHIEYMSIFRLVLDSIY